MRWRDDDGTIHQKSTRCRSELTARQKAAEWSARLQAAGGEGLDLSWIAAAMRYETEHLAHGSQKSMSAWKTASGWYVNLMQPQFLDEVTTSALSRFAAKLREALEARNGRAPQSTIATYLKQIRAFLHWAHRLGLLPEKVRVPIPRRAAGYSQQARSRDITLEEFERLMAVVPKVRPHDFRQWQRLLRGYWESGFRRGELLRLSWDMDAVVAIDTRGEIPLVRFQASGHKGGRDTVQPITPQFWELLAETPPEERRGPAFAVVNARGQPYKDDWVGRVLSKIGRRGGVRTGFGSDKCATSHDIGKRALTMRLAGVLSESELAAWQRHRDPKTTRAYYTHHRATTLAKRLWDKGGPETRAQGDT